MLTVRDKSYLHLRCLQLLMQEYSHPPVDRLHKSCLICFHQPGTRGLSASTSRGCSVAKVAELRFLNTPGEVFDQSFYMLQFAEDYLRSDLVLQREVERIPTNSNRLVGDALGVVFMIAVAIAVVAAAAAAAVVVVVVVVVVISRPYFGSGVVEAVIAVSYHSPIPGCKFAADDYENQLHLGAQGTITFEHVRDQSHSLSID
jgi:hypothetical protein